MKKTALILLLGILCGWQVSNTPIVETNKVEKSEMNMKGFKLLEVDGNIQILLEEKTGYVWIHTKDRNSSCISVMVSKTGDILTLEEYERTKKRFSPLFIAQYYIIW